MNLIFSNLTVLRESFYKWRKPHTREVICLWLRQGFLHAVALKNKGHKASEGAAKFTSFPGFYCSIVSSDEPRFQGTRVIDQIKPYLSKIIISWKHMSRKGFKKNPFEIFTAPPYVNRSVTPVFAHSSSSRWTRVVCGGRNSWLISREQWKVINPGKSTAAMRAVPFCRIWLEISVKPLILFLKTIIDNSFSLSGVSLEKVFKSTYVLRSQTRTVFSFNSRHLFSLLSDSF